MTSAPPTVELALDLILSAAERTHGKVLGLIGQGALGREIASLAVHYGMEVLYSDPEPGAGPYRRALLGELLATSDIVMTLHGGTANTLRDEGFIVLMKPGARLVDLASAHVAEEVGQPED